MKRFACVLVVIAVASFTTAQPPTKEKAAQSKTKSKPAPPPTPTPNTTAPPAQPPTSPSDEEKSAIENAALQDDNSHGADYVPCEFSTRDLLLLRASPDAAVLTNADSEALKMRIMTTARNTADGNTSISKAATDPDAFIKKIASENFTGKSQSEAVETIIEDYEFPKGEEDKTKTGDVNAAIKSDLASRGVPSNFLSSALNFVTDAADAAVAHHDPTTAEAEEATKKENTDAKAQVAKQQTAIIDVARQATSLFLRPNDVACAMQVFTFKEAQYSFGSIVAKNYIVVQINVRNLNKDQQFQIHDAEFAVDSDPSGRHGRFFSGSDKRVVRSFANAQTAFDARNLSVNITDAAGALFSSIMPIYKGSFADAVGVLTGGAIPYLGKVWKDRTTEQSNLLNDIALNPGTNGTSVPKSGVIQFAIFIPSRTYESGWWTLPCTNKTYIASRQNNTYVRAGQASGKTGLDIDRILEPCLPTTIGGGVNSSGEPTRVFSVQYSGDKSDEQISHIFVSAQPLPFKKWSGSSFEIFRELAFAAVSGEHTVEASDLAINVSKPPSCKPPLDKTGNVVFDGTNPITCIIGGQNLGTVTKVRLRNADPPADSKDFPFQPTSGDPTTGTISFDAPTLAALPGKTYTVLAVDKDDKEIKTPLAFSFRADVNPVIAKLGDNASSVDFAASKLPTLTIFGSHLDRIGSVVLATKTTSPASDPIPLDKHDAFSFTIDLTKATTIKAQATSTPTNVTISLKPTDATQKTVDSSLTFSVVNTTPATGEAQKPAVPGVPANQSHTQKKGK